MNLKHLTNHELHLSAIKAAKNQREATTITLHHICEIWRRRSFAEFGCDSAFDYCLRHLKFDKQEAARHVNAARVMLDFPEVEEKLSSSAMTLTSVSQAQVFFNREARAKTPISKETKREILEKIEKKSTREAERIFLSYSSQPQKVFIEKVRAFTDSLTEVTTCFDRETVADLDRLKEIWSHTLPGANYADIIKKAARLCVEQHDPLLKAQRAMCRKMRTESVSMSNASSMAIPKSEEVSISKSNARTGREDVPRFMGKSSETTDTVARSILSESESEPEAKPVQKNSEGSQPAVVTPSASLVSEIESKELAINLDMKTAQAQSLNVCEAGPAPDLRNKPLGENTLANKKAGMKASPHWRKSATTIRSRYIHSTVKHAVGMRDEGRCTFIDPRTGKRCDSRHRVQYDHIIPFTMGGDNIIENIRLRCFAHNQWHADRSYGKEFMDSARQ